MWHKVFPLPANTEACWPTVRSVAHRYPGTFYAKGQTGQQLLLGAYSALSCQVNAGTVKLFTRYEMMDLVMVDGRARGIIARNLVTGKLSVLPPMP